MAWRHQRLVYALLMQCAWDTLDTFARNDARLRATPGAVGVLHTHNRRLDLHPHVHVVMPATALDAQRGLWRTKSRRGRSTAAGDGAGAAVAAPGPYLFNHKALAKVFRAKMLDAIERAGLQLPAVLPETWVVDCRCVGDGSQALLYLGRYLYRGVIQEADILRCDDDGLVSFRYRDAKTDKSALRTLPGADFLWLVLQHVLPKGLRRSRNFGFLHHNCAAKVGLLRVLHLRGAWAQAASPGQAESMPIRPAWRCGCGQPMHVVQRRMPAQPFEACSRPGSSPPVRPAKPDKPEPAPAATMH